MPLIQDPQKFMEGNLPRRRRYFSTVPGRRNIPDLFGYIIQSSSFKTQSTAACSCMCSHSSCQTKCFKWKPARGGKIHDAFMFTPKMTMHFDSGRCKTAVTLQTPGTLAVYLDYLLLPTGICFDKNCMYSEHHCTRTVV